MISKSVCASPGGSIAGATSWMRRSAFVNVPVFSRNDEAGRIDVGELRRLVLEDVLARRGTRATRARATTCAVSGSVWATSSPKMYIAFSSPVDRGVEHLRDRVSPCSRESGTPQRCLERARDLLVVDRAVARCRCPAARPCRTSPARCSGRAAAAAPRPGGRRCRSSARGCRSAARPRSRSLCSVTPRPQRIDASLGLAVDVRGRARGRRRGRR